MPVRFQHDQQPNSIYFLSFTCYQWLPLIEEVKAYDTVYKWFDSLHKKKTYVTGYTIMPNHLHVMLYFPQMPKSLNVVVGNAKRFMAYEIVKRLKEKKADDVLATLRSGVSANEAKKGQVHKVFESSFDAKECYSIKFIDQKIEYMHNNPVSGKWQLANDFTEYEHSSASYYERSVKRYEKLVNVYDVVDGRFNPTNTGSTA